MNNINDLFGETIDSYSRKQAIEDGVLIDLTSLYPGSTQIFKWPVACTSEIWELIEKHNDPGAYVYDICYMSVHGRVKALSQTTVLFSCYLPIEPGKLKVKEYTLKAICGPGDTMEPVITLLFENQD